MAVNRTLKTLPARYLAIPAAAALLLWPAVWNGYPIVFADTGTYLSQAIHRYAGWDRPVFYSLFMLPLHATLTLWPVVVAQALLTASVLWLVCRALLPAVPPLGFLAGIALLSAGSCLPWIVSELMPDLFTPLLILLVGLLAWVPERLSRRRQAVVCALAAFMIACQQSSLPLACALSALLGLLKPLCGPLPSRRLEQRQPDWYSQVDKVARKNNELDRADCSSQPESGLEQHQPDWHSRADKVARENNELDRADCSSQPESGLVPDAHRPSGIPVGQPRTGSLRRWSLLVLPPALAMLAMATVNLAAHGRFAISPFGNVFLLARVIYDGPGLTALQHDCQTRHWRLCPFRDSLPPTSDDFLWSADSPLNQAGGPKAVSADADAIISAALRSDPAAEARAALANTLQQLGRFASGDGLTPWAAQVTPWIERDFPTREAASYAAARQQAGILAVPDALQTLHTVVTATGVIACLLLLPFALKQPYQADCSSQPESGLARRAACAGFLLAVLLALPISAAITGSLSAPHERYQSRIIWLPAFVAMVSAAALRAPRSARPAG